jgi:uncharacterized protein YegP (UPF0339 family)
MSARFEVVRTDAEQPWHARFIAANGRIVWTTENYGRRRDAVAAVMLIGDAPSYSNGRDADLIELRDVDERDAPVPFTPTTLAYTTPKDKTTDRCQATGWTDEDNSVELICELPEGHDGTHADHSEGWEWR